MTTTITPDRLAWLAAMTLDGGAHGGPDDGACAMEAAAFIAGEYWSDHPQCVSPVIAAFMRGWNDGLPSNDDRDRLLKPLIPLTIGTTASAAIEDRRAWMATDWLVRVHAPAWLRLAGLTDQAAALSGLPEIASGSHVPGIKPAIEAARRDAAAAWAAAMAAAWDAAMAVARDAAWAVARDAARAAAGAAAWAARAAAAKAAADAAWAVARDAADAAWAVARDAAGAAAWAAARDAADAAARKRLATTMEELQDGAADLVRRMCAAAEPITTN